MIRTLLTISLISLAAALVIGLPRLQAQCQIVDAHEMKGIFQPVLQTITLRLYAGNDQVWPAVTRQVATQWSTPAVSFVEPGAEPESAEPRRLCWYNPLWPGLATLNFWGVIFPPLFWMLLTLAIPTGGVGLAGWLWQPGGSTSAGQYLAVRLHPEGNPHPWLEARFNLLLGLTLGGLLWSLWQIAVWLPANFGAQINLSPGACLGILTVLLAGGVLFMLYQVVRQFRLGLVSRGVSVELSANPLQPGQTVQLYLRSRVSRAQVNLVCRQTVEQTYTRKGETRYRHRTFAIYEAGLGEESILSRLTLEERILSLTIPLEAQPTLKKPLYDPIAWAVVVRLARTNAPDIALDFPFEVVQQH
ncbi:MAG TPA: hypothetical protein P5526_15915 [Anaerolineae bacterium]|nr:hypothetical protein [Anaerolineae bacterium]MCB0222312.1 hypothetical protein [Anaerolineae bacterium]HRV93647.1 hypothetical protein [Anaerolineae bacterium]